MQADEGEQEDIIGQLDQIQDQQPDENSGPGELSVALALNSKQS
jgi:hypothetical protein